MSMWREVGWGMGREVTKGRGEEGKRQNSKRENEEDSEEHLEGRKCQGELACKHDGAMPVARFTNNLTLE